MPLAFESFGAVSEQTVVLMANLVSKAAELSMIPYSVLLSYWQKRISTIIMLLLNHELEGDFIRHSYTTTITTTLQIHNARIRTGADSRRRLMPTL
jgi:hypothetical protein